MSPKLQPMVVQYSGHVSLSVFTKLYIYEVSYKFDTVLYQFLETGTPDIVAIKS